MAALIIPEKNSVAKDIAAALGGFSKIDGGYANGDKSIYIIPARGHVVELLVPEAQGFKAKLPILPEKFDLQVIEKNRDGKDSGLGIVFQAIKKHHDMPSIDCIINACDAGREGELICRYILAKIGSKKPLKRMWLQSMTQDAIREAWANLREGSEFNGLFLAAQSRSEADWLAGINGSRAVTNMGSQKKGVRERYSVGRVQTPVLAIVADRETAIKKFVPKDYFEIHGTFGTAAGQYVGRWSRKGGGGQGDEDGAYRLAKAEEAQAILARVKGAPISSAVDQSSPVKQAPPKLYDLTGLQKDANKKLGLSAADTLKIAQALYETHKVLTYPRTDAPTLPEDYGPTAEAALAALKAPYSEHAQRVLANKWVDPKKKRIFDNSKIQDHFAIIPTGASASLDGDERKIYDMVVKRFIAAFHPDAEFMQTTRTTIVAGEIFKASGRVLVSAGWKQVYGIEEDDDKTPALCLMKPGEPVKNISMKIEALKTKPPARYTEATLLGAMETAGKDLDDEAMREAMGDKGLGTPATRAATIEKLLDAKMAYMQRSGKSLVPTDKGMELIAMLRDFGLGVLASPEMTGEWEKKLRQVELGTYKRRDFMAEIRALVTQVVDVMKRELKTIEVNGACPKCGGHLHDDAGRIKCGDCDWMIYSSVAKRQLSAEEIEALLRDKSIPLLSGFVSTKTGKSFNAGLKLTGTPDFKVEFVFEKR